MANEQKNILLVENDDAHADAIQGCIEESTLGRDGPVSVTRVRTLKEAGRHISEHPASAVLCELEFPDSQPPETLSFIAAHSARVPFVVITSDACDELGIEAVRQGAQDYIARGEVQSGWFGRSVRYAIERHRLHAEALALSEQLDRLTIIDALTQTYNRRGLERRLQEETGRVRRHGGSIAAIMIDCDDFGRVNKLFGHAVGDVVLRDVADRIFRGLRPSDILARVGGDEFVVLLPNATESEAVLVADRVLEELQRTPVLTEKEPLRITASGAVARLPEEMVTVAELLELTRNALSLSKNRGKNRVVTCTESGLSASPSHVALANVAVDGMGVVAQPLVDLVTGAVLGHELLSRPRGDDFATPLDLFRCARQFGQTTTVDLLCLRACIEAAVRVGLQGAVHVNLLPSTLLECDPDELGRLFAQLPPGAVGCLELSEQQFIGHADALAESCRRLQASGVQIAVDDLGSGHGTLDNVILLEPDIVKFDVAIVQGHCDAPSEGRILPRFAKLCGALNLMVVAEGIETSAQLEAMKSLGLRVGQGFLWAGRRLRA